MHILVFFAETSEELIRCLEVFQLPKNDDIWSTLAKKSYRDFLTNQDAPYRCCIIAESIQFLEKEVQWMIKGIQQSMMTGRIWKTPSGSFFNPLFSPKNNRVAFVYPGNGSAYPGLGYSMLQKIPVVKKAFFNLMGEFAPDAMQANLIFPNEQMPDINNYSRAEKELNDNFYKISSASLSFSWMYTYLLREVYGVHPHFALGYSIGEIAMLLSLGVWQDPVHIYNNIMCSPIFFERITGKMLTVRDYWHTQAKRIPLSNVIWKNIIIRCSQVQLNELIKKSSYVYLMAKNTESEFMIGGHIDEMLALMRNNPYDIVELPYSAAVHTPIVLLEKKALTTVFSSPANTISTKLFSAASKNIAYAKPEKVAQTVTSTIEKFVDFPALIWRTYSAGARIFIEVGGRNVCCNWIGQILKDKPHAAIPLNIKGMDDHTAILKALSMLIGYGVTLES